MNNYKIAILVTTFLRDSLLYNTIQSIVDNYTKDCILLIADQGYSSSEKETTIDYFKSQIPCEYYRIPFDCGLSYARNFLINKAKESNIPYILMSADSIQFIDKYNFQPIIDFLESNTNYGLVGFELLRSKCSWEYYLKLDEEGIHLIPSNDYVQFNECMFKKVDICRNIFLAKTSALINLWDNEMKLCEHELAFLELKKRNYSCFWTNNISFKRINSRNPKEFEIYRSRFKEYQQLLKRKLNIKNWVIYEKEKNCK
jgi:hypothetical protein